MVKTRRYVLAQRPKGLVNDSDFRHEEHELGDIQEGEVLAKLKWLSFDPAQRGWMNEADSYRPPMKLNEPVEAGGIVEVIESRNPDFKQGDLLGGMTSWQEHQILTASSLSKLSKIPPNLPPNVALNVCGTVGLTALFGLLRVGEFKEGDVVLVSGAAGATGSLVGQIAKAKGAKKVIGIAGGADKVKHLTEVLKFDAGIDYKNEDVAKRIKEEAPEGVNVYFDNVGGKILEASIANMKFKGRIVCCGSISNYNATKDEYQTVNNLFRLTTKSLRMEGFIVTDFLKEWGTGRQELLEMWQKGQIQSVEDIQEGWENIPKTFFRLFKGENTGKQLARL